MSKKKKSKLPVYIVTPFLMTAVCAGVIAVAAVKPADKLKTYANIAFMDNLKSDPLTADNGLVIQDNDIITDYNGETSDEGQPKRPSFGELYAIISCDKLSVDVPVYWGTTPELLEHGGCQSSSSSIIGTEGNSVISAHVDTFFEDLPKCAIGDTVTINTNYGKFTYTVRDVIEFPSTDRSYIKTTDDDRLTLYTCKRDIFGTTDKRIGIICDLKEKVFYAETEVD